MFRQLPVLAAALVASLALLQEPAPKPVPNPVIDPSVAKTPHRQFDFWLGEWDVKDMQGNSAGKSRIALAHRGAVLREEWFGTGGGEGTSTNIYDRTTKKWNQVWVDDGGTFLQLQGGLDGKVMEMRGSRPAAQGDGVVIHRIRWEPRDDGTVRQTWDTSPTGAEPWTTLADLIYTHKPIK